VFSLVKEEGRMPLKDVHIRFRKKYNKMLELKKHNTKLKDLPTKCNLHSDGTYVWVDDQSGSFPSQSITKETKLAAVSSDDTVDENGPVSTGITLPKKTAKNQIMDVSRRLKSPPQITTTTRNIMPTMAELKRERDSGDGTIEIDALSTIFFGQKRFDDENSKRKLIGKSLIVDGASPLHDTGSGLGLLGCRTEPVCHLKVRRIRGG
jgi:hypothetical protein